MIFHAARVGGDSRPATRGDTAWWWRWGVEWWCTRAVSRGDFAAPVIGGLDITTGHMQAIVNAAPTPGEGNQVQGMISALVSAGITSGYPASPSG